MKFAIQKVVLMPYVSKDNYLIMEYVAEQLNEKLKKILDLKKCSGMRSELEERLHEKQEKDPYFKN
jgi:hypothetical protein